LEACDKLSDKFIYVQKINQLALELIHLTKLDSEKVYENTVWRFLNDDHINMAEEIFYKILNNPEIFVDNLKDEEEKCKLFLDNLSSRIKASDSSLSRDFELIVFDINSVDKLKSILSLEDFDKSELEKNVTIEIKYVSSPHYQIVVSGLEIKEINEAIDKTIQFLTENSNKYKSRIKFDEGNKILKKREFYLKPLYMNSDGLK